MRWTAVMLVALWGCSGSRIPYSGQLDEADAADMEPASDVASLPSSDVDSGGDASGEPDAGSDGGSVAGTDTADPGADAVDPGADAVEPGADAAEPGADAAEPGADAAEPGTDAVDPGTDAANPGADGGPDGGDPCMTDGCAVDTDCSDAPSGTPCSDGNACTVGDQCAAGVCVPGGPLSCDDGDPCTFDLCSPLAGCASSPLPTGAACGPVIGCMALACVGGQCAAVPRSCNDDKPCTADSCDEGLGCVNTVLGDLPGCCAADTECDDGNPCTDDTCDKGGDCHYALSSGPCNDGSACTAGDTCTEGECAGAPIDCADANPCTVDACNVVIGCLHAAAPNGTTCADAEPCLEYMCLLGACVSTPVSCDDDNPCTADWCGEGGVCHNDPVGEAVEGCCTSDAHCDDHDVCTIDVCDVGALQCEHSAELGAYLNEAFDEPGTLGVTVWSSNTEVGFGPSADRFMSPPQSLYLGSSAKKSYDAGIVHATATLPPIAVPAQGHPVLGFWLWQDVLDKDCTYDVLSVLVDGETVLKQCTGTKGWVPRTVDLAKFAGKTITITLDFDSRDGKNNQAEGAYIDDVILLDSYESATSCCTGDADCGGDAAFCTNVGGVCLGP